MRTLKRLNGTGTIHSRLLTIALVPSIAALLVGAVVSGLLVSNGLQASSYADKLGDAAGPSTAMIGDLQDERRVTLQWISDDKGGRSAVEQIREDTDKSVAEMQPIIDRIESAATPELRKSIGQFRLQLGQLKDIRSQVDANLGDLDAVYGFYNGVLDTYGIVLRAFARTAPDATVTYEQVIAADLFDAADAMSRGHALAAARTTTGMTQTQYHEYIHQIGAYHEDVDSLVPRMTTEEQQYYQDIQVSPSWKQLDSVQDALEAAGARSNSNQIINLPVSTQVWQQASHDLAAQLDDLYKRHADYAASIGKSRASATLTTSLFGGLGIVLLAVGVFLVAYRLSRLLIQRLTRLRSDTLGLADRELPTVVARLGDGERIDVEAEIAWLDYGKDEIGEVAAAFNEAQRTAISASVQEAKTRQGVRSVFLNIAHRSQVMVHRQLQVLDRAERLQEDPDQLEILFELDHLATQSRRNAENLIILGGERPGRQWRNPVLLPEIVGGAVAEIEHYTRVDTGQLPESAVQGKVVSDLIHLLAELLDNATSFSPPESHVLVRGNVVGKGIVVEIEDQGLGIEQQPLDELNTMLRTPPDFGVMALSTDSKMGLFVVGHLASRHDIKVTLRESAFGGVHALVLIPTGTLVSESDDRSIRSVDQSSVESTSATRSPMEDTVVNLGAWPSAQDQAENRPSPEPRAAPTSRAQPSGSAATQNVSAGHAGVSGNIGTARGASSGRSQSPSHDQPSSNGQSSLHGQFSNGQIQNGQQGTLSEYGSVTRAQPGPSSRLFAEELRPSPTAAGNPANGDAAPAEGKRPLPQRKRNANIAAPLRDAGGRRRSDPERSSTQDSSTRTAEQFRASMSAVQYGTRRARHSDPDANPGRQKGEQT